MHVKMVACSPLRHDSHGANTDPSATNTAHCHDSGLLERRDEFFTCDLICLHGGNSLARPALHSSSANDESYVEDCFTLRRSFSPARCKGTEQTRRLIRVRRFSHGADKSENSPQEENSKGIQVPNFLVALIASASVGGTGPT